MPSPESWTSVRSQKDLKPRIWTFFSLSKFDLCGETLLGRASPCSLRLIQL
jgi:hypothetical protein